MPWPACQWAAETSIYIRQDVHRLGLGKRLYEAVEAISKAQGLTNLYAKIRRTLSMARSKYQVLVIPYYFDREQPVYGVFRRRDMGLWQFISGGGEDTDGSIEASARREAMEEAGLCGDFFRLDTCCSIPANSFRDAEKLWGRDCFVVPEYAFALRVTQSGITLSDEHTEYRWEGYETVRSLLQYDSNRTALWELDQRLKLGMA